MGSFSREFTKQTAFYVEKHWVNTISIGTNSTHSSFERMNANAVLKILYSLFFVEVIGKSESEVAAGDRAWASK